MPLKGIPSTITPELLYALAKMGHGDSLVIADANFPSDSVAAHCVISTPIRVSGLTSDILKDILNLLPLDTYEPSGVFVMDRVQCDKDRKLHVPAYGALQAAVKTSTKTDIDLVYCERFDFYKRAKGSFCVVQTDDVTLYANVIVHKGVVTPVPTIKNIEVDSEEYEIIMNSVSAAIGTFMPIQFAEGRVHRNPEFFMAHRVESRKAYHVAVTTEYAAGPAVGSMQLSCWVHDTDSTSIPGVKVVTGLTEDPQLEFFNTDGDRS